EFIDATNHLGPIILAALFAADVASTLIFTLTTKKEVSSVIDTSDPENAAVKEFRLKHLISNHHSSTSREQVLKMIKERPKNLTRRNLNRLAKNYPNMHFKK
ncbi:MAG: putative ABC transporter permease, partial [Enterococcus sp.]